MALSNERLGSAQEALMQSEKLASMGQLAAGIAHEVNNPLGVVLMYAHILLDEHKNDPSLREELELITVQADRCKKIVSGLLQFARRLRQSAVVAWCPVPNAIRGSMMTSMRFSRFRYGTQEGRTTSRAPISTASSPSRQASWRGGVSRMTR